MSHEKEIAKLKNMDDVRKFRKETLRPMKPGEKKRALRIKLREKIAKIRKAQREKSK